MRQAGFMVYLGLALLCAVVGVVPLLARRRVGTAAAIAILTTALGWWMFYANCVSLVYPLLGFPGAFMAAVWLASALLGCAGGERRLGWLAAPVLYLAALITTSFLGSHLLNARAYAALLGPVEAHEWTQDVQPKDPRHLRMVALETAKYIASKAVANAGAIGSQFSLTSDLVTLQRMGDRLVYVLPFDFEGFSQWQSVGASPGFVIVDAEDPEVPARLVQLSADLRMRYMPGAFFGKNLERHLRVNGFLTQGLETPRFELDEQEHPHWVVPIYRLTLWWGGPKIEAVAVVDPVSGAITRYAAADVPAWVDRVYPGDLVEQYVDERGEYAGGWWNSFWAKQGLTTAETPTLVYGSDGRLKWVTGITSTNERDDSLIGLIYTDSHSGRSVYYRTNGGATDTAILQAVDANQQVKFRHLHGAAPQIYNVDGAMTSVVPLLNDNRAYQGVAFVRVANPQDVAVGATQREAQRAYQSLLFRKGQQIEVSRQHQLERLTGVVDRIRQDLSGGNSVYLFHLRGVPRIFAASSGDFVKVALTQPGDTVMLAFIAANEETVAVRQFDNPSLPIDTQLPPLSR